MPERTAPRWFRDKLKAIDRRLEVRWHDRLKRWFIGEAVPRVVFFGYRGGSPFYRMRPRLHRAFWVDGELGSGVLDWIRRNDARRFSTAEKAMRELGVDATPEEIAA